MLKSQPVQKSAQGRSHQLLEGRVLSALPLEEAEEHEAGGEVGDADPELGGEEAA